MQGAINSQFPLVGLRSVAALMDVAVGVEREAALRYEQLAALMDRHGDAPLAGTFRDLAAVERAHEAGLAAWALRHDEVAPSPAQFGWQLPETFSWDDVAASSLSPYQALGIAVRNEERAFVFYTYVAAQADARPALRDRAEALARQELAHVAQLRQLRRRAYHAGRHDRRRPVPLPPSVGALYGVAAGWERGVADRAAAAARCLAGDPGQDETGRLLGRVAAEAGRRAEAMARQATALGVPAAPDPAVRAFAAPPTPGAALGLCQRAAAEVLDAYLSIADRAQDETMVTQAQALAEAAMARLALIRAAVA